MIGNGDLSFKVQVHEQTTQNASRETRSAHFPIAPKSTGHSETGATAVAAISVEVSSAEEASSSAFSTKAPPLSSPKDGVEIAERHEISGTRLGLRTALSNPMRAHDGVMVR